MSAALKGRTLSQKRREQFSADLKGICNKESYYARAVLPRICHSGELAYGHPERSEGVSEESRRIAPNTGITNSPSPSARFLAALGMTSERAGTGTTEGLVSPRPYIFLGGPLPLRASHDSYFARVLI